MSRSTFAKINIIMITILPLCISNQFEKETREIGEYYYSHLLRSVMGLSRAIAGCVDVCVCVYFGFVGLLFCMTHLLIYIYKVVWATGAEGMSEFFKKMKCPLQWKSSEKLLLKRERKKTNKSRRIKINFFDCFSLLFLHVCVGYVIRRYGILHQ